MSQDRFWETQTLLPVDDATAKAHPFEGELIAQQIPAAMVSFAVKGVRIGPFAIPIDRALTSFPGRWPGSE